MLPPLRRHHCCPCHYLAGGAVNSRSLKNLRGREEVGSVREYISYRCAAWKCAAPRAAPRRPVDEALTHAPRRGWGRFPKLIPSSQDAPCATPARAQPVPTPAARCRPCPGQSSPVVRRFGLENGGCVGSWGQAPEDHRGGRSRVRVGPY